MTLPEGRAKRPEMTLMHRVEEEPTRERCAQAP